MHVRVFGANGNQVPSKSLTHVVTVAEHQAKSEKFVVLQDIQYQIHKIVIYVVKIQDEQIFLFLLIHLIVGREQYFLGSDLLQMCGYII